MNRSRLARAAAFAVLSGAFLGVADAAAAIVLPEAAAAATQPTAAQALLAALADEAASDAWLSAWAAPEARAELSGQLAVVRAAGPLTLLSETRNGDWTQMVVESRAGRTARLGLRAGPDGRVAGLDLRPVPKPFDLASLEGVDLGEAIGRRVAFAGGRDDFAGVVLALRGDETVYAGAWGEARPGVAFAMDQRVHLGSMDKQFTAVAIAQLVEAGRLTLDTRLIDVLPDYPNRAAAEAITVRMLLNHTAGLGSLFDRPGWDRERTWERMSEVLPAFAAEPLLFEPGARAQYSNEGFVVLGAVVEAVSGQDWYAYVQSNILDRAGMADTGYPTRAELGPREATQYLFASDDALGFGPRAPLAGVGLSGSRGVSCGGGYSTAADMIAFLRALRDGRLVSREVLEPFVTQSPGGLANYGLGFQLRGEGAQRMVGHSGGGPNSGINADARIVWETGDAYAVMGNLDAPFAQTLGADIGRLLVRP